MDKALEAARQAFLTEAECLRETADRIDWDSFRAAVDVLAMAERIGASGCGHSGIACQHFAHLMCCIERPARFISPSEAVHGGMGFVQKGDVMLLASRGGKTAELLPIMEICRKKGVTVIAVTQNRESELALGADIVLYMHVTQEVDPFNTQGTTSNTALNAQFDALQAALIQKTDYKVDKFALVHPGGAVGARLNEKKA